MSHNSTIIIDGCEAELPRMAFSVCSLLFMLIVENGATIPAGCLFPLIVMLSMVMYHGDGLFTKSVLLSL